MLNTSQNNSGEYFLNPRIPPVTQLDRDRGWAELEIELTDGKKEFVRVHMIGPSHLESLLKCAPENLSTELLKTSLRVNSDFVARIHIQDQGAISAMLADLMGCEAGDFLPPPPTPAMQAVARSALTPAVLEALEVNKRVAKIYERDQTTRHH
jgi:hypothetical protein